MPSLARVAFTQNVEDIHQLLELQEPLNLADDQSAANFEVLNKSAIVLLTAFWESYCEDIASEGLEHIVQNSSSSADLPTSLKKQIATEIKNAPNELEVWKISDQGWKIYLKGRLSDYREKRNRRLNTPKTAVVDELFRTTLGINNMSQTWNLSEDLSVRESITRLDKMVELRGAIAHRGTSHETVTRAHVESYLVFIAKLAARTGRTVNRHVKKITKSPLWE